MDSAELKESLGERAKDIIANGLRFRVNRNGMVNCPLHNDKKPSMSWFKDGLMWRCHACGGQIDIYEYYTKFENLNFNEAKDKIAELLGIMQIEKPNRAADKQYSLPKIQTKELSQEAIELMGVRKLTKETLDDWKVKQSTWNGKEVYAYQYFLDGILKHVTYREIAKGGFKGGCEKNTEAILWGMWHVDKDKPLVITEGQPDAMAVWQSGYKNVVSVPGGANNFTWIDNCWEWLQGVKEFIIWADNDKPGLRFADEIKSRLKNVKVVLSDNLKDANEVMWKYGSEGVLKIINKAIEQMPTGILDVAQMEYKSLIDSYSEGIETGFIEYDSHVEDWKEEEITIIFGRNGEGKTTFVSQVISHCLEKKTKTFLYSGEMSDNKIQDWLYKQLVGNKQEYLRKIQTKYKVKTEVKPEIVKVLKEWHKDTFYLFDRKAESVSKDLDKFFELMELAACRYGVKLFIIDNLMSKLEENADSLYSDQANFVQRCKDFAVKNRVHVVLLAHPNKTKDELKSSETGNLEKTDISGSNNIPNKADNIIAIERNWDDEREFDAIVTSLKDRESGERKAFKFLFSKNTLRFYNNSTKEDVKYSWEKNCKDIENSYVGEEIPNEPYPF